MNAEDKALLELHNASAMAKEDPETAHETADKALCDLLITLGYDHIVLAYNAIKPKWYA